MAIAVTPVLPVLSTQGAGSVAPDLTLEAGSVVKAEVLKVLSADLVRIAIAGLSVEVQTEVPLQPGQNLQLAVSQNGDGIRLQLVGPGTDAGDTVKLSPGLAAPAIAPSANAAARDVLTPLERVTVTTAVQGAAAVQGSQAPLFANLAAVVTANLPPKLQAAVAQVLAQQTSLDDQLSGADLKAAFQKSGLLLEASLASGAAQGGGAPDLKAALLVLRQTLSSLGTAEAAQPASVPQTTLPATGAAPGLVPDVPELLVQEILLPQARLPTAHDLTAGRASLAGALADAIDAAATPGGALNLLQEAARQGAGARTVASDALAQGTTPPPPFRGALPAAQAIAEPTLAPDAPLSTITHRLGENTDAALARHTLLQVASLPDRGDAARPQLDATAQRWNFEVPFFTQQGTAMAQFEISRDGGGTEAAAAARVWRARFTLDVEPAGPVHALVALSGDRTSVRMWAERPATARQLRAGAAELTQALAKAELMPGDIEIRDGSPPLAAPAPAGHFLDRAS